MRQKLILPLLLLALLLSACAAQGITPYASLPADGSAAAQNPEQATQATGRTSTEEAVTETAFPVSSTEAVGSTEPAPVSTEPEPVPSTEAPEPGLLENEAFTRRFGECCGVVLAAIYNQPFSDGIAEPNLVWNEGEFDQLVIYPRYVGSTVAACRIVRDGNGAVIEVEAPAYRCECADGDSIAAALERPEGGACWLVTVRTPNGAEASYELDYNGRYGTLCYEYLTDPTAWEDYDRLPSPESLSALSSVLGSQVLEAFLRAAARDGLNPGEAMRCFCSPCRDIGDAAAYTVFYGEMDGDSYFLEASRLHENYDPGEGTLTERTIFQADLYAQIGNELGILGPEREGGEELYFELKGLTVYNPTLMARRVAIKVNSLDVGSFDLSADDFCTLIPLDLGPLDADLPVSVQVQVLDAGERDPALAILEVWPGLGGNISGAR